MSCVVSIGDAYSHESPQAGTLLRLFELLHSVVVEPARVAEATYLKEHLPAAVDIDEFVVDAATQPPTLLGSMMRSLTTGSSDVLILSVGQLPTESQHAAVISPVLACEHVLRGLRCRMRCRYLRNVSVKLASMNLERTAQDVLSKALGVMSGRESRTMLATRGAVAGADGTGEALSRMTRYCVYAQLNDNMTMQLVLKLIAQGKFKGNIAMLGHLVVTTPQLVADKIYEFPDDPVDPASVLYDFENNDQTVFLNRFVERNNMLVLLLPFIDKDWTELSTMPLPLTLQTPHIGKTRRMVRLPGSAQPDFFREELCTGWLNKDPSTRAAWLQ